MRRGPAGSGCRFGAPGKGGFGRPGRRRVSGEGRRYGKKKATAPKSGRNSSETAPEAAKTADRPAAKASEAAQAPVRYAIQIMASSNSVSLRSSQFGPYRGKVKQYVAEGRFPYKYCVGEYADEQQGAAAVARGAETLPQGLCRLLPCRTYRAVVAAGRGGRLHAGGSPPWQ